jgi:hypothetical protein
MVAPKKIYCFLFFFGFILDVAFLTSRSACPKYEDIADLQGSMRDFNEQSYQGEWVRNINKMVKNPFSFYYFF